MRTSKAALGATLALWCIAPACATDLTDVVPRHPGVTYAKLFKQLSSDFGQDLGGNWTIGRIPGLRDIDGKPIPEFGLTFKSVDVLTIKEAGHERLLLLTDESSGEGGFDEVLAVFDDEPKVPKLLDAVDVGRDQSNGFGSVMPLSANTDAFLVVSTHSNSNESYELTSPLFLRNGILLTVMTLFSFGSTTCSFQTTQEPAFSTQAEPGSPYRAIVVRVTTETTPGNSDCGEDQTPPKHSTKVVSDLYRWNARKAAFLPLTGAIQRLSDANFKAVNN